MIFPVPSGETAAQVTRLEHRADSVVVLHLRPATSSFPYEEGQYLSVQIPGTSERRAYSMASPYVPDGEIELHIRLHPDGLFSRLLRERIEAGSFLNIAGPFGNCVWDIPDGATAKVILLATGTGIAPLKAMLERRLPRCGANEVWLYWGAEHPDDFYLAPEMRLLEQRHPRFHFTPVLRTGGAGRQGPHGFVQDIAALAHPDLRNAYVFACGAPAMVHGAHRLLVAGNHLAPERFYADAFESSTPSGVDSPGEKPPSNVNISVTLADGSTRTLGVPAGESLMRRLVSEQIVQAICGGNQSCGTCRVAIAAHDAARLSAPGRAEKRLLRALPDSGPRDRLSCQIVVVDALEGLHITIPAGTFDSSTTRSTRP